MLVSILIVGIIIIRDRKNVQNDFSSFLILF